MAKKVKRASSKTRASKDELRASLSRTGMTGGGLGAFFGGTETKENKEEVVKTLANTVANIPIEYIHPNAEQPRVDFAEDALNELADSIRQLGIIQPITVRYVADNKYEIISGERRWRASKLAELKEVPAFIRIADDQEMMEMALVENIQREDLNPWEVANTYYRLMEEFKLTQKSVSERVGKKRATVANYLGLLKIENPEITKALKDGDISMGHGRELVTIDDSFYQNIIFRNIIRDSLSVRATEKLAKLYKNNSEVFTQINAENANPELKNELLIGDITFEQAIELAKVDIFIYQNFFITKTKDEKLTTRELHDFVDMYVANRVALEVAAKNIANINELEAEELKLEHLKEIGRLTDQGQQDEVRAQVVKKNLTPLQTANLVDAFLGLTKTKSTNTAKLDADFEQAQRRFKSFFGSNKVKVKLKEDGSGQVVIPFEKGNKALNELLDLIDFAEQNGYDSNK
ncbi:MAG: ParB/RepB/Spo0J family partition protein [Saprospiraceae bacterium]